MKALLKVGLIVVIAAVVIIVALRLLFPLPSLDRRTDSTAIAASADTTLGAALLPAAAAHGGASGVLPLREGGPAFAARALLARAAERSIDAQYYIWQKDTTGLMLLEELLAAAERGVRVRLLLDDDGTSGLDPELAALDALPTVEVRLFNPFTLRSPKKLSYVFDFPRLNRRMHNKAFTVDGIATIVGGRNIGDIYFSYGAGEHYVDLDALAVGQAAADASAEFDRFWASASSYPADRILAPAPDGLQQLREAAAAARATPEAKGYVQAIASSLLAQQLEAGSAPLEWVPVTIISDDPAKGLGQATSDDLLISRLDQILGTPEAEIDLVSAYFIPGDEGTAYLSGLAERGVSVRVLTNAEESTDVILVHSSYVRYREALLAAGVKLFELRADTGTRDQRGWRFFTPAVSGLHAKTFAVDRNRVFIGSLNLDPRSVQINTEMGVLIQSPVIAGELAGYFDTVVPLAAYSVDLAQDGSIEWVREDTDGTREVFIVEPNTTALERGLVWVIGLLPIEWML